MRKRLGYIVAALAACASCTAGRDVTSLPPIVPPGPLPPPPPPRPQAGRATRLAISGFSYAIVSGQAASVTVQVVNDSEALVDTAGANITLSLVPDTAHPILRGTLTATSVHGIASFGDIRIDKASQRAFRLVAQAAGLAPDTTFVLVVPGAASRLAFRAQPLVAPAGEYFHRPVEVALLDSAGNVTTASVDVSLALAPNAAGAVLQGEDTLKRSAGGVASFTWMHVDRVAAGLRLVATAQGLSPDTSATFAAPAPQYAVPTRIQPGFRFKDFGGADGPSHCALATDNTAWCWGANDRGQLGNGTTAASVTPVPVAGGHTFTMVRQGGSWSCGLSAGDIWCWGGDARWLTPVRVSQGQDFVWLTSPLCGRTRPGRVLCGQYQYEGASIGTVNFQPALSDSLGPFAFAGTSGRVCAITRTGAAFCDRGFNTGDSYLWDLPQPESQGRTFTSIAPDNYHTCALASDGSAWCWGWNASWIYVPHVGGQLGDGTLDDHMSPVAVAGGHTFASIVAGHGFSCGLEGSGTAWCWGDNFYGELGIGTTDSLSLVPARVAGNLSFRMLYAGWGRACGVTTSDEVWCWGSNTGGEIKLMPAGRPDASSRQR